MHPHTEEASAAPTARCVTCGTDGAEPRPVSRVMSFVVVTSWRTTFDPLCATCGARRAAGALVTSAVLGWWGVPWGVVRTPGALVTNARTLLRTRALPTFVVLLLALLGFAVPVAVVAALVSASADRERADREEGREFLDVKTSKHLEAARAAARRGDAAGALRAAQAAVAATPGSWLARQELANAYVLHGNHAMAAQSLRVAVRLNPDNRDLATELVLALFFAQDDVAEWEAGVALDRWGRGDGSLHAVRASARALAGKLDGALEDLRAAGRASLVDLTAAIAVAQAQQEAGRVEDGIRVLADVEREWKGPPEAVPWLRRARAFLFVGLGRLDQAKQVLADVDLDQPDLRTTAAVVALEAGEHAEAEGLLSGLRKREDLAADEVADVRLWHGAALLRLGRVEEARAAWALPAADATSKPTLEQVACEHLATGHATDALRAHAATPATRRQANDVAFIEGMRLEASGDRKGAAVAYRRALDASTGSGFPAHLAKRSLEAVSAVR